MRPLIAAVLALSTASCAKANAPGDPAAVEPRPEGGAHPMNSDPKPTPGRDCVHDRDTSSVKLPAFDGGVLLQTFTADREGELFGFRVFADGRHERLRPGAAWTATKTLPPDAVEKLRSAIAAAKLSAVAGVHRPPTLPDDATLTIVQAGVDPRGAVVVYSPCRVAPVDELFAGIGPLL